MVLSAAMFMTIRLKIVGVMMALLLKLLPFFFRHVSRSIDADCEKRHFQPPLRSRRNFSDKGGSRKAGDIPANYKSAWEQQD